MENLLFILQADSLIVDLLFEAYKTILWGIAIISGASYEMVNIVVFFIIHPLVLAVLVYTAYFKKPIQLQFSSPKTTSL